ncbi:MAG: hypothetical protein FWE23_09495 [Chitinivibrionia bacterium]|nr:hypothetical protein [Chitinivibrionia bacterium]
MEKKKTLSYEEIMAMMEENAKGFAELRELQLRNEKKAAERAAKADERAAEADKRLEKLDKLIGGVSKNNGLYAEEFFQHALEETKTFAGIKFDKILHNAKAGKKEVCEFDIVLVNGDSVAIIEVKNRIHPNFVEDLATTKLSQFRKYFPEYAKYKVYLGVAGLSFDKEVVEKAKKYGVGVIRQHGKTIEMNADALKSY